mmetsp:Transcript_47206/g.125386  ORF Transcript_47206/g.125386 Transcript_47206/m.125386 type:complete len:205 (+) Transcript_47206:1332-1946(+)
MHSAHRLQKSYSDWTGDHAQQLAASNFVDTFRKRCGLLWRPHKVLSQAVQAQGAEQTSFITRVLQPSHREVHWDDGVLLQIDHAQLSACRTCGHRSFQRYGVVWHVRWIRSNPHTSRSRNTHTLVTLLSINSIHEQLCLGADDNLVLLAVNRDLESIPRESGMLEGHEVRPHRGRETQDSLCVSPAPRLAVQHDGHTAPHIRAT